MAKEIQFENELILHLLTQKHLKKLFDLKCVASEIQINGLRLDNLAFDENTNSFVIIEYKNRRNDNVLNQAEDYYNLVSKEPKDFLERLENPEDVKIKKTRVMIISPEFKDDQIREAKSCFELWEVSLYDDCHVEYRNLATNEIKTLENLTKDDLKLTEKDLLRNKSDEICQLYCTLKDCVKTEFSDVKCKILVDAISFKTNDKIICNVEFLKKSFNAHYFAQDIADEKDNLRDISDISTGGNANYELKINSTNDLDYFMDLFKQVYDQKRDTNE